jgi:hypothetical protein
VTVVRKLCVQLELCSFIRAQQRISDYLRTGLLAILARWGVETADACYWDLSKLPHSPMTLTMTRFSRWPSNSA